MLLKRDVFFTPAGKTRTLHIWLPEEYDHAEARYPVMYFFDGHNLFCDVDATYGKSWGLAAFLTAWEKPIIIVGLECGHEGNERLREYCPYTVRGFGGITGTGERTLEWMIQELKPLIDREYRTYFFREATAIGGSSMGGLMSLYAAVKYNQYFSKAACLSSALSLCMPALSRDIAQSDMHPDTRVYLSWGTQEAGADPGTPEAEMRTPTARRNGQIAHALTEKGANVRLYCQQGGRHCEADWEKQLARVMNFLWLDA